MKGTVIILDGSPSVGKSTISREIQEIAEDPYFYFSIDDFMKKLPSRWIEFTDDLNLVNGLGYQLLSDEEGKPMIRFKAGPVGEKLIKGYINAIKGISDAGNPVIADAIITDPKWLEWLADRFEGYPIFLIGLRAPLSVLENREKKRYEPPGMTRGRFDEVYGFEKPYQLEIDTSQTSPQKAAEAILRLVKNSR